MKYPELEDMKKRLEDFIESIIVKQVTEEDIKNLLDYVSESSDHFFKYVVTTDGCSRKADLFQIVTILHLKAYKNTQSNYYKKYRETITPTTEYTKKFTEWQKEHAEKEWFTRPEANNEIIRWFEDFLNNCNIEYFKVPKNENSKSL
jgi:hypothetical protein